MFARAVSFQVRVIVSVVCLIVAVLALSASPTPAAASGGFDLLGTPRRLADTRVGTVTADGAGAGTGRVPAGGVLTVHVAGRVGVDAAATNVALNVTAVDPGGAGYLTVYPCGEARPNASNLNYHPGRTLANAVIARLGSNGAVCIFTLAPADIVVDLAGVLTSAAFSPLTAPQRLADTRPGASTIDGQSAGGGRLLAGSVLVVAVAGRAGIDLAAGTVALNVAAVDPGAAGYLTIYPCGQPRPNASNLNYYAGRTIANAVTARVGAAGSVCIFTLAAADVVVDVAGSFAPEAFTSLAAPQRLADTRPGAVTVDGQRAGTGIVVAGGTLKVAVSGRAQVPGDATAVVLNVTAVDAFNSGFVTVYPNGEARPNASNLNGYAGLTVANMVVARLGKDGAVCIFTSTQSHIVVDVAGYIPGPPSAFGTQDCPTAPTPPGTTAIAVLDGIVVENEHQAGYSRSLFPHWLDSDGDGCDTRAEVLIRDSLTPATINPGGCDIVTGDWLSPYDGQSWTSAADVEIDHVVALKEAWDSGAWAWSPARRTAFANDLDDSRSLRAVTADVNSFKGDKDPSNWLPDIAPCQFLVDWVAIKARWSMSMDQSEAGRIRNLLNSDCAGLTIAPWPAAPTDPAPLPPAAPTPPPPPTNPPPGGNCHPSYPTVCIPPPPPDLDCGDIPYRRFTVIGSDPHRFDADHDGIGCES